MKRDEKVSDYIGVIDSLSISKGVSDPWSVEADEEILGMIDLEFKKVIKGESLEKDSHERIKQSIKEIAEKYGFNVTIGKIDHLSVKYYLERPDKTEE